jgi:hypothetical protein
VVRRTARNFLAEKQVAARAMRNQRHEIDGYRGPAGSWTGFSGDGR